jgi:hypothetical protein
MKKLDFEINLGLKRETVTASGGEWNNEESHYSGDQVKNDQKDEKYSTCGRL